MSEQVLIIGLMITCIIFVTIATKQQYQIDSLKREILALQANKKILISIIEQHRKKNNNKTLIPTGTIEAVKEAMKRAHPDNGGNEEEFRKYRRAYNVLMGKEKL